MDNHKTSQKIPHNIIIEDRNKITITGVYDIDKFEDSIIVLFTVEGGLILRGKNFRVTDLNSDTKTFKMEGCLNSLLYSGDRTSKNIVKKIFR